MVGARRALLLVGLTALLATIGVSAAAHGGGSFAELPVATSEQPDWMRDVPDTVPLRELSIPGTHETMARFGGRFTATQTLPLGEQLEAGIRAIDIRLRLVPGDAGEDILIVTHGPVAQAEFGTQVLAVVDAFLAAHPTETVLMRTMRAEPDQDDKQTFEDTFERYVSTLGSRAWRSGGATNPTLGELRGRIVVLEQFFRATIEGEQLGIPWSVSDEDTVRNVTVQDDWRLCNRRALAEKWLAIRDHFQAADGPAAPPAIMVNTLSGNTTDKPLDCGREYVPDVDPRFVASGLESGTFEPASTGTLLACDEAQDVTADRWNDCPTFFHLSSTCRFDLCRIEYEGTNALALRYLAGGHVTHRTGIVMMDFPAGGLIGRIIGLNPSNAPPVADAGGPYRGDEGAPIVLDASGSSDPDGDALRYRWDVDGDGSWDTPWSDEATTTAAWPDDHVGTVIVEVSDGMATDSDDAPITVHNVAPDVTIDEVDGGLPGVALVAVPVDLRGSFTDPGLIDTHTADVDWGDGTDEDLGPVTPDVAIEASHTFTSPGRLSVRLSVRDDDGGIGVSTETITVHDAAGAIREAIAILDTQLADGPDPGIRSALVRTRDDLDGNRHGRSSDGALDALERGNDTAALTKVGHALRHSRSLASDDDVGDARMLTALAARSLAQLAYDDAATTWVSRGQQRKLERLSDSLDAGIAALDAGELGAAVTHFRDVVAAS